jgi:RHH-type proline utilization regulon transcriptional repressor/proline dehydrogenase/delta 1-pyrroline-5-carboxylate dehydrogenase
VFELPAAQASKRDSWAQREIFGPVIHIVEYESLIEAVELFNGTEYALTGGVYAQSQDDIDFLVRFLRAGNLYINRPNTGARVAIEPFGGFKLSGTGPKAGGPEYMWQFRYPRPLEGASSPETYSWAQDSGYQLTTPKSSLISIKGRVARFETFAASFLGHYEQFMGGVSERDKAQLVGFVNWVKDHLEDYLKGRHQNFRIPGQLSYNDKSLIKEAGLFVTVSGRPGIKAIHYLLASLALGSGLSVACVTQESWQTWKQILDLAWKAGFSKANLDLSLVSPEKLPELFASPAYSFIFAGAFAAEGEHLYREILNPKGLTEHMRLILSDVDGVSLHAPEKVLDQFVWTRSLAINTMRHGAPLELGT